MTKSRSSALKIFYITCITAVAFSSFTAVPHVVAGEKALAQNNTKIIAPQKENHFLNAGKELFSIAPNLWNTTQNSIGNTLNIVNNIYSPRPTPLSSKDLVSITCCATSSIFTLNKKPEFAKVLDNIGNSVDLYTLATSTTGSFPVLPFVLTQAQNIYSRAMTDETPIQSYLTKDVPNTLLSIAKTPVKGSLLACNVTKKVIDSVGKPLTNAGKELCKSKNGGEILGWPLRFIGGILSVPSFITGTPQKIADSFNQEPTEREGPSHSQIAKSRTTQSHTSQSMTL